MNADFDSDLAPPPPPPRPRTASLLLGVFICWQLWFLFSQNILGLMEELPEYIEGPKVKKAVEMVAPGFTDSKGHVMDVCKWVSQINKPWLQLTGQAQSWALFSGSYNDCIFPAVMVLWDDTDPLTVPWPPYETQTDAVWRTVPILAATDPLDALALSAARLAELPKRDLPPPIVINSPHEPRDVTSYFRWWQMRMRRYETGVVTALAADRYPDLDERMEYYERRIVDHLDNRGYRVTAYMKFRFRELLETDLKGLPRPKHILLLQRRWRTVDPEDGPPWLTGPYVTPLLMWTPPEEGDKEKGVFRRYHAPSHSFRRWE